MPLTRKMFIEVFGATPEEIAATEFKPVRGDAKAPAGSKILMPVDMKEQSDRIAKYPFFKKSNPVVKFFRSLYS